MPAVSFYLKQDVLDSVRAKAQVYNIPVSRIIRQAVEEFLKADETKIAKERILDILTQDKPLGGMNVWDEIHMERTKADDNRD
jgi:hypothetical protein